MAAGFHGLLDFVGYPVGVPLIPSGGRGFRGAGRRQVDAMAQAMIAEAYARSVLQQYEAERYHNLLARRELLRALAERAEKDHQQRIIDGAVGTVLLSEL